MDIHYAEMFQGRPTLVKIGPEGYRTWHAKQFSSLAAAVTRARRLNRWEHLTNTPRSRQEAA